MQYFGFVYIWRDRKHKMFYIGSHMGLISDKYICSSQRMIRAYRKRPEDFTRKILYYLMNGDRVDLLKEEERWLSFIKTEELGKKYYNLKNRAAGGKTMEFYTAEQKNIYQAKLKESAGRGADHHNARAVVCFGVEYSTVKEARETIGFNPQRRLIKRNHLDFYYVDQGPVTINEIENNHNIARNNKLRTLEALRISQLNMSEETRRKRGFASAEGRKNQSDMINKKISNSLKARPGKRISINGQIYNKTRIASEKLNIKESTIKFRIKSKNFPSWFYID